MSVGVSLFLFSDSVTPWTVACQAPLSMVGGCPHQEAPVGGAGGHMITKGLVLESHLCNLPFTKI